MLITLLTAVLLIVPMALIVPILIVDVRVVGFGTQSGYCPDADCVVSYQYSRPRCSVISSVVFSLHLHYTTLLLHATLHYTALVYTTIH